MGNKKILIIATAATEGGALTILTQLLDAVAKTDSEYTVIVNENVKNKLPKNHNISYFSLNTKKWLERIFFDFYGAKKLLEKINIDFDLCINMQNIPIRVDNLKQIVYMHQPIPFSDLHFSLFNPNERMLWLYKRLYLFFIKINLSFSDIFIVQTSWVKDALVSKVNIKNERVLIIKPSLPDFQVKFKNEVDLNKEKVIFYPAAAFSYKNHDVLIRALSIIGRDYIVENRIKVIFTITKDEIPKSLLSALYEEGIFDYVNFLGRLDKSSVNDIYSKTKIMVFPSRLETFGLPLLEAAYYGLDILASDLPYAKEVLCEYNKVFYCDPMNAQVWADKIKQKISCNDIFPAEEIKYTDGWGDFVRLIDKL